MNALAENPRLSPLQLPNGEIWQSKTGQGVTSATAALYEYALSCLPDKAIRIMEAGSGSGVLAILLKQANPKWKVSGLEIQDSLNELAKDNAAGLNLNIDFINADLRLFTNATGFDCIISNPPWQKLGSGIQSPIPERAVSRSEMCCTMRDLLSFCKRNLAAKGYALLLYPAHRSDELHREMAGLQLQLVASYAADRNSLIFHIDKG